MKHKLLFVLSLGIMSCHGQNHSADRTTSVSQKDSTTIAKLTVLEIDRNSLSATDNAFIKAADSTAAAIDEKKCTYSRSRKSIVTQNGTTTEIIYKAYSEEEGGSIDKVVSTGNSATQKLKYIYYYANGKVFKSLTEIIDSDPFSCTIYYLDDKAIHPKAISDIAVENSKALSVLALGHFKAK